MTTGIHNATFQNLQLNAGAFVRGFDYTQYSTVEEIKEAIAALIEENDGTLLGMTQGGGNFKCAPSMRNIEGDGLRSAFVGGTVNDGWNVSLSGTMKEITPDNFKDALISADIATEGNVTTLTVRTDIKEEDYISTLCWIGDTSKGLLLIVLENALNTAGATFSFTDQGEGTIPFEYHAHHKTATNQDEAPCKVIFLEQ